MTDSDRLEIPDAISDKVAKAIFIAGIMVNFVKHPVKTIKSGVLLDKYEVINHGTILENNY